MKQVFHLSREEQNDFYSKNEIYMCNFFFFKFICRIYKTTVYERFFFFFFFKYVMFINKFICFSPHVLFHVDNRARLSVSCFILSGINDTCF